ncbi:MAG: cation-transporting P-type ATPase [Pseudomonadota bacterium]
MDPHLPDPGLSSADAAAALAEHGQNVLPKAPPRPWWGTAAQQFQSSLVVILAVAIAVAAALGEWIDASVIAAVLVLNAALGFFQEWRAETALAALTSMLDPTATVRRNGREATIAAREVVPGDILLISTGDRIAADAQLVTTRETSFDESILTGESLPVTKAAGDGIFAGTTLVSGGAEARVTATGAATDFAQIAKLTGGIDRRATQLQIALGSLAKWLGIAAIAVGILVAALGLLAGQGLLEMTLTAISLAVAMVPEGLPAVVTITLALGAGAMVRRQALVRRMQAVETLGAASVICTDKTGTLTENEMRATTLWCAGQAHDAEKGFGEAHNSVPLERLASVARSCTHAAIVEDDDGKVQHIGSPTELALLRLAAGIGVEGQDRPLFEAPFSSERKRMSVLLHDETGPTLLVKGAPEVILDRCTREATEAGDIPLTDPRRAELTQVFEDMAAGGLRIIGLADRKTNGPTDTSETDLCLLGFAGLMDPPRKEVAGAISLARQAGMRVIMITGDSPVTARAIAEKLGLPVARVLTGAELHDMGDEALADCLRTDILFARTRPADKLRLVGLLQASGAVVAMTGDGVNDAPALKQADIGVAMGQRGTDVAQEAADVILLDDNFATIVNAIEEGRRQFANIKKFVRYLLSSNAGEVVALVVNLLVGGPLIFLPTQILWMNLITDGVTAVALGLEKAEPGLMDEAPRTPGSPVLGRAGLGLIAAFGLYTGAASLFLFYRYLPEDPALANTLAFTAMVVFEKVSVFAFRSLHSPVTRLGWLSNRALIAALLAMLALQVAAVYLPPMQVLLQTVPLSLVHWQWIAMLAVPLIVVPEVAKVLLLRRKERRVAPADADARVHGAKSFGRGE